MLRSRDRSDSAVHALSLAGETLASVHETTEGKTKLAIWALGDEGKLKRTATIDFADLQPTIQVVGDSQVVVVDQLGEAFELDFGIDNLVRLACEIANSPLDASEKADWLGGYEARACTGPEGTPSEEKVTEPAVR
jgi:hypothetical protein